MDRQLAFDWADLTNRGWLADKALTAVEIELVMMMLTRGKKREEFGEDGQESREAQWLAGV